MLLKISYTVERSHSAVMDSDGVAPSGVFDGGHHWLGSFDQCLRAKASGEVMHRPGNEIAEYFHDFDAKYFRVYFRSMTYLFSRGVCLPATCSRDDVSHMLGGEVDPTVK